MGEMEVDVPREQKELKVVNIIKHGFVGITELFKTPQRRFGAVCISEKMIMLRFTFKKKIP